MVRIVRTAAVFGAAALALAIGGCGNQAKSDDPAAVQNAIKADDKKWNDDYKSKNVEGLIGHYADGAFLVADGATADGTTEIRKTLTNATADHYFSVTFASDKVETSGDLAYARGHFTQKHEDPKTQRIITDTGTYLTVYRKQADGSWKAVEDFIAADPSKAKSEPVVVTPAKMISF